MLAYPPLLDHRYKPESVRYRCADGWSGWASDVRDDRMVWIQTLSDTHEWRQIVHACRQLPDALPPLLAAERLETGGYLVFAAPAGQWQWLGAVAGEVPLPLATAVQLARRCTQQLELLDHAGLRLQSPVDQSLLLSDRARVWVMGHLRLGTASADSCLQITQLLYRLAGEHAQLRRLSQQLEYQPASLESLDQRLRQLETAQALPPSTLMSGQKQLRTLAQWRARRPSKWPARVAAAAVAVFAMAGAGWAAADWAQNRPLPLPDAVGGQQQQAVEALRQAGWPVRIQRRRSDKPAGQVIAQRPAAGTPWSRQRGVQLQVSAGGVIMTLPDLQGMPVDNARQELLRLRLRPSTVPVEGVAGVVVRSEPAAGSQLPAGSEVLLFYGSNDG